MIQPLLLLKAIIRVFAIQYFVNALILLANFPDLVSASRLADAMHHPPFAHIGTFAAASLLLRFLFNLVASIVFWFGAARLASLAGRGLSSSTATPSENTPDT